MDGVSLAAGRYRLACETIDGRGVRNTTRGDVELSAASAGRAAGVRGTLSDGFVLDGSWDAETGRVRFVLLYNGAVPFEYDVDTVGKAGKWRLQKDDPQVDEQGHLDAVEWHCIETAAARAQTDSANVDLMDGNNACAMRHVSSITVPCSTCGSEEGKLAFFELTVPNFGAAELVNFSCGECGYKRNDLRTTQAPKDLGATLTVQVDGPALDATCVLSDSAVLFVDALELEMRVGAGKLSTLEGVLRSCATTLVRAGFARCADDGGGGDVVQQFEQRVNSLIDDCRGKRRAFEVRIEDALGLSWVGETARVSKVEWPRTDDQNAELGLVDASAPMLEAAAEADAATAAAPAEPQSDEDALNTRSMLKACEALAAEYTREYQDPDGAETDEPPRSEDYEGFD